MIPKLLILYAVLAEPPSVPKSADGLLMSLPLVRYAWELAFCPTNTPESLMSYALPMPRLSVAGLVAEFETGLKAKLPELPTTCPLESLTQTPGRCLTFPGRRCRG
jgi:hypothetical protein